MKDILRFLMAAMAVIALASCGEKPEPEPEPTPEPELNQNLAFTLEVTNVEANSAKISVSHNGTSNDTWYGFATTNSNVSDAINAKYLELTSGTTISGLKKQTSTTVTVNGLEPETEYTYIAFGLSEDGELYGKANSVKFTTLRGEVVMEVNSAWTVAYAGPGTIGEQEYDHTVTVTSTDKNKYFITGIDKPTFDANTIKDVAEYELAYFKAFLDEYNAANGTNITFDQMLFEGNGIDALGFTAGEWYALAIGVDANGDLSGLYAISDVITIAEEEPTPEYAAWLGDWTLTGANGLAQEVTFHKGISNQTYYMTGYEGSDTDGLYAEIGWSQEDNVWFIYNQNLGTYNFGEQYGEGEIWFIGMDEEMSVYLTELPICIGGTTEDGTLMAYPYEEEYDMGDGSKGKYSVNIMAYIAYFPSINSLSFLSSTFNDPGFPTFPLTITPSSKATKSADVKAKSVQKFANAPRTFKTYYQAYCNILQR